MSKLIENLLDEKKTLLKSISPEHFKLICEKGFYPYELVDNVDKLNMDITELKQCHFDSRLNLSKLTNEEWEHVQNVIKVFDMKTLRDFHNLYLKVDVYGLRDVFE